MKILKLTPKDDLQYILNSLTSPATIYLAEGVYRCKAEISAGDVTLIGAKTIRQTVNMSDTENSMSGNHFLIAKTFTASNAAIITINRRMSTSLY